MCKIAPKYAEHKNSVKYIAVKKLSCSQNKSIHALNSASIATVNSAKIVAFMLLCSSYYK